ncbi:MAG: hypothetical protein GX287_02115 [Fusobacteria bacterium]|nr:hypothetical protein [Fusobacteriota bacterium]
MCVDTCEVVKNKILEIEKMLMELFYKNKNIKIINDIKKNILELSNIITDEFKLQKLSLLEKKIKSYEKGLICYSDLFFEECMYILNCIEKGVC